MIDTHCHLTFPALFEQVDAVIARAAKAGVDRMITVATSPADAVDALAFSSRLNNVFTAVGVHPHEASQWCDEPTLEQTLKQYCAHPKVVAFGEMGLDRHYPDPPIADQKRLFERQLQLATEIDLPIVIHNREATDETIAMIRAAAVAGDRFVFHCFTGEQDELDAILDLGAMVSFTGVCTFDNARAVADCAKRTPLDRLMIETDSPYLTPAPYRTVRPNEPRYVADVARFLAKHRGMTEADFIAAVDANAHRFFHI